MNNNQYVLIVDDASENIFAKDFIYGDSIIN